jgi:surface antigen
MIMVRTLGILGAALALALGLAAPQARADDCDTSGGAILGALGGAALGGFLGHTVGGAVGGGTAKAVGTGLGVVVGGLAGHQIAKGLTCRDRQHVQQTNQQAQTAPVGQEITWNNPDSGNSGTVTAVRDGTSQSGEYCREFKQTLNVEGKTETGYGVACRDPNTGEWKVREQPN